MNAAESSHSPSRQFVVMRQFGSDRTIADMVRRSASGGPRKDFSSYPPRIATLRYAHLGFVFVLVAERSGAEGSVGHIFI